MAALIGDFVPDLSRFHSIISGSASIQQTQNQGQQHSSPHDPSASASASAAAYRSSSRKRSSSSVVSDPRPHKSDVTIQIQPQSHSHSQPQPQLQPQPQSYPQSLPASQSEPHSSIATIAASSSLTSNTNNDRPPAQQPQAQQTQAQGQRSGHGQALDGQSETCSTSSSRGGGPPSSSPTAGSGPTAAGHGRLASMAPHIGDAVSSSADGSHTSPVDRTAARRPQPSPPSHLSVVEPGLPASGSYLVASSTASQRIQHRDVIHVRDLAHIESLVHAESLGDGHGTGILQDPPSHQIKYEISGMPISDIIEMVAALLTKITATNDLQHDAMQRNVAHQQQASQNADASGGSQMSPLSHSVLAFHGKNVPAITILSYLSRIHKYCPTTYEVFLSLLVYFDRMTERVNDLVTKSEEARRHSSARAAVSPHDTLMRKRSENRGSDASGSDLADDDDEDDDDDDDDDEDDDDDDDEDDDMIDSPSAAAGHEDRGMSERPPVVPERAAISPSATYFVVDSFNIHRLIIAGVTCASKFFSDVFYTNSRYAKVGGLPLAELNHLEIQFLVLNDFRLAIPVEDLETYATMLVEFYAREVVAPKNRRAAPE